MQSSLLPRPSYYEQRSEIHALMPSVKTTMKSYKGFSGVQRMASYKLTMRSVEEGLVPVAVKCNRCGQTEGTLQYHNEDYDQYLDVEPICLRCHLVHHSEHRAPVACAKYWSTIKEGKMWEPLRGNPFVGLQRDHGIF